MKENTLLLIGAAAVGAYLLFGNDDSAMPDMGGGIGAGGATGYVGGGGLTAQSGAGGSAGVPPPLTPNPAYGAAVMLPSGAYAYTRDHVSNGVTGPRPSGPGIVIPGKKGPTEYVAPNNPSVGTPGDAWRW